MIMLDFSNKEKKFYMFETEETQFEIMYGSKYSTPGK